MPLPVESPPHAQLPEASFNQFAEAARLPAVFGPEKLAEFLELPLKTIYRLHERGMPRFGAGKQVRYRRDKVLAWLEGRSIERPGRSR